MPKAYDDDESEFEVTQTLVKLTWTERLKYLVSASKFSLTVSVFAGIFSLAVAFFSVIDKRTVTIEASDPLAAIGRRLSEQAVKIGTANAEIRRAAQTLPQGETQTRIMEQYRIIEEEAAVLKVDGDGLAQRDKRSSLDIFSPAYAQSAPPPARLSVEDVRLYGIVLILMTLGTAFVLCIGIILFSNHAKRLTFAIDTVKVLMGFFVGVATSFFGAR